MAWEAAPIVFIESFEARKRLPARKLAMQRVSRQLVSQIRIVDAAEVGAHEATTSPTLSPQALRHTQDQLTNARIELDSLQYSQRALQSWWRQRSQRTQTIIEEQSRLEAADIDRQIKYFESLEEATAAQYETAAQKQ